VSNLTQFMYRRVGEVLTQYRCSGMEIHEYMSAKSAFIIKMLRLSNKLTDAEIEDIRRATSSALRIAPIKLERLMIREFVIGDVDALLQAGLAPTIREAEELTVEIIKNAGMAKRKHLELAVLVRGDRDRDEDVQMVGRVGIRIIEDVLTIAADGSLRQVLEATSKDSKPVGRMSLLYAFFDPVRDDVTITRNTLDAFVPALARTVQKDNCKHDKATNTDTETVWHLLGGSKLLKIDDGNVKGGTVFLIDSST
jgi:FAD/FMN-containing dehydrogenase